MDLIRAPATDAETFIASLWRALEECQIKSPRLSVDDVDDALNVRIRFRSTEDGALVGKAMSRLTAIGD